MYKVELFLPIGIWGPEFDKCDTCDGRKLENAVLMAYSLHLPFVPAPDIALDLGKRPENARQLTFLIDDTLWDVEQNCFFCKITPMGVDNEETQNALISILKSRGWVELDGDDDDDGGGDEEEDGDGGVDDEVLSN
jgi:hypothetical protein